MANGVKGYYTTGEAATATGTSRVLWRNWALGQGGYTAMPGAKRAGRDWMIPAAVVRKYIADHPQKGDAHG